MITGSKSETLGQKATHFIQPRKHRIGKTRDLKTRDQSPDIDPKVTPQSPTQTHSKLLKLLLSH